MIYGSCVSRDPLELLPPGAGVRLHRYVARQSIISSGNDATIAFERLEPTLASPFQERMLTGDVRGDLFELLRTVEDDPPAVMLWDLTDERNGVYALGPDRFVTASQELRASGLMDASPPGTTHLPFGTDEHFRLFRSALDALSAALADSPIERVLLLRAPWQPTTAAGVPTGTSAGMTAEDANAAYERYYDAAESIIPCTPMHLLRCVASDDHRWGRAPFHYDRETNLEVVDRILGDLGATSRRLPPPDPFTVRARRHPTPPELAPRKSDVGRARALLEAPRRLSSPEARPSEAPEWAEGAPQNGTAVAHHSLRWIDPLRRVGHGRYAPCRRQHELKVRAWLDAHPVDRTARRGDPWGSLATASRSRVLAAAIATWGSDQWWLDTLRLHGEVLAHPTAPRHPTVATLPVFVALLVCGDILDERSWVQSASEGIAGTITRGRDRDRAPAEPGRTSRAATGDPLLNALEHLEAVDGPKPTLRASLSEMLL